MINKDKKYVFLGTFNNEDDAYDYLDEIFEVLHLKEVNNILDGYQNLYKNERKRYYEMINFYQNNDIIFRGEYNKRFNVKRKELVWNTKAKKSF